MKNPPFRMPRRSASGTLSGCLLILLCLAVEGAAAKRVALLVGVGQYQSAPSLEGPPNDVAALKAVLVEHWGFESDDVVTLIDAEATRSAILRELRVLEKGTAAGDHIFFYFSGHGTSVRDTTHALPLPHSSGALVPADYPAAGTIDERMASLIVGSRDLRPVLERLDGTGRTLFVAFDACYSGAAVRSGCTAGRQFSPGKNTARLVLLDESPCGGGGQSSTGGRVDDLRLGFNDGTRPKADPYPYRDVLFIAAASDSQVAEDVDEGYASRGPFPSRRQGDPLPTIDGKAHGAFTDILLRVLAGKVPADANNNGVIEYAELFDALNFHLDAAGYAQDPQLLPELDDDRSRLRTASVLSAHQAPVAATPPMTSGTEVLRVRASGLTDALQAELSRYGFLRLVDLRPDLWVESRPATGQIRLRSADRNLIGTYGRHQANRVADRVAMQHWVQRLLRAPLRGATFNLALALEEGTRGHMVYDKELIAFTVTSEKPAHLLLLNVDASGDVTVLYPYTPGELAPIPANRPVTIPGSAPHEKILVQAPFGTDYLLAYGFRVAPAALQDLRGRRLLPRRDVQQLERLQRVLLEPSRDMARASMKLVTQPRSAAGQGGDTQLHTVGPED